MKIIFAGGGTGGHIFPSLAILNSLNKNNKKIQELFLISKNNLDEEILKKNNLNSEKKINYQKISSGKFRRYFDFFSILENFLDFFKFIFGFFQSLKIILKFKPDLIFCKGGFVSLPVALAGKILGKKIILHESDSVMGFANKIIAKFCIGKKGKIFYGEKIGNPINFSGKIFSENEKNKFIQEKIFPILKKDFPNLEKNFLENKKILFISGGSQGAEEINFLIDKRLEKIIGDDKNNFFIIHLTGKGKFIHIPEKLKKNYLGFQFLSGDEYFNFLQISDLLVSRAGAGSISEILFFQKPAILIPLKSSAGNHQVKNAEKMEKNGLAKVFREHFLEILNSDFSEIEKNLKKKNFKNPADEIAKKILEE